MEQSVFKFQARTTHSDLKLHVQLNGKAVVKPDLTNQLTEYEFLFNDTDDGICNVEFVLSGKTVDHTKIDQAGDIVADESVEITDVTVDDIDITQVFVEQAVYCHSFNNTKDPVEEQFFGTMGCNGTVRLSFSTPFYIWLLENM
jgi:hypothetical protein